MCVEAVRVRGSHVCPCVLAKVVSRCAFVCVEAVCSWKPCVLMEAACDREIHMCAWNLYVFMEAMCARGSCVFVKAMCARGSHMCSWKLGGYVESQMYLYKPCAIMETFRRSQVCSWKPCALVRARCMRGSQVCSRRPCAVVEAFRGSHVCPWKPGVFVDGIPLQRPCALMEATCPGNPSVRTSDMCCISTETTYVEQRPLLEGTRLAREGDDTQRHPHGWHR